ncbi:unnamed protein product [Spirodela intermedia]|uniref:Strictosidine synthase conserved region domain-containing protein n=1 Tax=Spirodela intermedia TaxID=51605 RepID=A0A7I8ITZ0_SPIIN|nr:unnamed protein product [Spirodela intermedia]CAA6661494.1 unnamed protein product [Spirodela intermedia]
MAPSSVLTSFFFLFSLVLHHVASSLMPAAVRVLMNYEKIQLQSVTGPESLAFDAAGGSPYTGVSDGRVLKWNSPSRGWVEFAVPKPDRNGARCNGLAVPEMEDRCGRPLGLQFHRATGNLYIADAYYGLLVVGPGGGPFGLTNGVDVEQERGFVYFTDSSTQFQRREWIAAIAAEDARGRFMRYDPERSRRRFCREACNSPTASPSARTAALPSSPRRRGGGSLRYWLKGPMAGKSEVFSQLPGFPDNVKGNRQGELWVAIVSISGNVIGVRLDANGRTVELLHDRSIENTVSEVLENNGTLWLGSIERPFVGMYSL